MVIVLAIEAMCKRYLCEEKLFCQVTVHLIQEKQSSQYE